MLYQFFNKINFEYFFCNLKINNPRDMTSLLVCVRYILVIIKFVELFKKINYTLFYDCFLIFKSQYNNISMQIKYKIPHFKHITNRFLIIIVSSDSHTSIDVVSSFMAEPNSMKLGIHTYQIFRMIPIDFGPNGFTETVCLYYWIIFQYELKAFKFSFQYFLIALQCVFYHYFCFRMVSVIQLI